MSWLTRVRWIIEAILVFPIYAIFRVLPLDAASLVGGAIFRTIGPHLPVARIGRNNLRRALPELDEGEREMILEEVFDNLGRTVAEYPHLATIARERVELEGGAFLDGLRDDNWTGLCVSAHIANWEVMPLIAAQHRLSLVRIYRAINNPYIDALVKYCRGTGQGKLLPKGREGARQAVVAMARGEHVGMLLDQKMNDGIAVPFFGRDAMTAPALAQLALRFECPVLPARVERLEGARFRLTVGPILVLPKTGDREGDIREGTAIINRIIEGWVREQPGQWLWLHRRWPDS